MILPQDVCLFAETVCLKGAVAVHPNASHASGIEVSLLSGAGSSSLVPRLLLAIMFNRLQSGQ